jgi:hypothetical protein
MDTIKQQLATVLSSIQKELHTAVFDVPEDGHRERGVKWKRYQKLKALEEAVREAIVEFQ